MKMTLVGMLPLLKHKSITYYSEENGCMYVLTAYLIIIGIWWHINALICYMLRKRSQITSIYFCYSANAYMDLAY